MRAYSRTSPPCSSLINRANKFRMVSSIPRGFNGPRSPRTYIGTDYLGPLGIGCIGGQLQMYLRQRRMWDVAGRSLRSGLRNLPVRGEVWS
jgi:hypothetical protein